MRRSDRQFLGDLNVASINLGVKVPIRLERLLQREQMLGPPRALQRQRDLGLGARAPLVPERRQPLRIAFASADRRDDRRSRHADDAADHRR